jgi:hypothetical protein
MRQGRANARLPGTLGKPSRVAALFLDSEAAYRDGSRSGLNRPRPAAGGRDYPLRAMGLVGSAIHSLHEPGYRREPGMAATDMARTLWHAVTPDPQ